MSAQLEVGAASGESGGVDKGGKLAGQEMNLLATLPSLDPYENT
jgi:hypothetical protein